VPNVSGVSDEMCSQNQLARRNNDEDVLITRDPDIAGLFVEEFGRVYQRARMHD
jgi:hypothetical protein